MDFSSTAFSDPSVKNLSFPEVKWILVSAHPGVSQIMCYLLAWIGVVALAIWGPLLLLWHSSAPLVPRTLSSPAGSQGFVFCSLFSEHFWSRGSNEHSNLSLRSPVFPSQKGFLSSRTWNCSFCHLVLFTPFYLDSWHVITWSSTTGISKLSIKRQRVNTYVGSGITTYSCPSGRKTSTDDL